MSARARLVLALGVASLLWSAPSRTEPDSLAAVEPAARSYLRALELLRAGDVPFESVWRAARALKRRLLERDADGFPHLEALSEPDYAELEQRLAGVLLNREEVIWVWIDPVFFQSLAREYGDALDVRFTEALAATYPPQPPSPEYVEPIFDYSGCVKHGSGTLVGAYRRWRGLRDEASGRYAEEVQEELDAVAAALFSACSCASLADVEQSLRAVASEFPDSEHLPEIELMLGALAARSIRPRPNCRRF